MWAWGLGPAPTHSSVWGWGPGGGGEGCVLGGLWIQDHSELKRTCTWGSVHLGMWYVPSRRNPGPSDALGIPVPTHMSCRLPSSQEATEILPLPEHCGAGGNPSVH